MLLLHYFTNVIQAITRTLVMKHCILSGPNVMKGTPMKVLDTRSDATAQWRALWPGMTVLRPLNVMECALDRFSTNKCNKTKVSECMDTNKHDEKESDRALTSASCIGQKGRRSNSACTTDAISRKTGNVTGCFEVTCTNKC